MSEKVIGGFAFPLSTPEWYQRGMTLRDWFAGQALAGILAAQADPNCNNLLPSDEAAREAYNYADEMLRERRSPEEKTAEEKERKRIREGAFTEWKQAVDHELLRLCGRTSKFLPDMDYWGMFNSDIGYEEAAAEVVRNAKG